MQDISGFGLRATLRASNTFSSGLTLTQFADDQDAFDAPSMQIKDKGMGLNGDMVVWSTPNAIAVTLSVIPGTEDDQNLAVLFEANRVGRGKSSAADVITLTLIYPDGSQVTYNNGVPTDGVPGRSVASAGRMKSKAYAFAFEGMTQS